MRKKLLSNVMLLLTMLFVGVGSAWADEVTYTFTAKYWTATLGGNDANWTSGKDGAGFSNNGIQVTTSASGANGTSPVSYDNVSKIVVTYNTNKSRGAGSIVAKIGENDEVINNVAYSSGDGTSAGYTTEFTYDTPQSGNITLTVNTTTNSIYLCSVTITYDGGGGSTELEDNDLALTGAPIALNFDLYNNKQAQAISYTTSSTGEVSVEAGNVSCYVDQDAKTITVTPMAVTNGSQTVTINQAADDTYKAGSVTFTVTITDSTPIETHTATFSVNGTTNTQEFEEGEDIVFPANPADVSGKTFVGWTATAINGTTNEAPTLVKNATMGESDVTFYAVFAFASGSGSAEVKDVLNRELTGVTGTSYSEWSDKTATSSAVYAGQSAGGNEAIQLRSNNSNSGIITTTSGGKVTKVAITWNGSTSGGRTVNVYGNNSAYSAATDLYNVNAQGTLLGTIVCGTSTELDVTNDYEYVGLRSASGALYLDKVEITWSAGGGVSYSDYCTTVVAAAVERPAIAVAENPFTFSTTATITCATEGATIYYSIDNTNWTEYTQALNITATTTIYAKAVKGNDESSVAEVTATKNLAVPTVAIDATGITNTNVFDGTAAGSLSATVTYNDAAVEGATVTWSGNNDEVATINAATGAVTLVAAGKVTFTATYAGNADYSEKAATYEMTVTNSDPNAPGTENNPYTVAQAIAAIDASSTVSGAYVKGIVSQVDSYNSNYKSITYWISDDGTTTTQLQAYSGKGLNSEDFASIDDVAVGDEVVVCGDLKLYNGTYEFNYNNYLVSTTHQTVKKAATNVAISGTLTNMDVYVSTEAGQLTAIVTSENVAVEGATVSWTSSNPQVATIDENGVVTLVAKGAVKFTATYNGDDTYDGSSATTDEYTVISTKPAPAAVVYSKVTSALQLVEGAEYLMVNEDASVALGKIDKVGSNMVGTTVDVTTANNQISITDEEVNILTLTKSTYGDWHMAAGLNDGAYLSWESGNTLSTKADETSTNARWAIEYADGVPTIVNASDNSRKLQYNSGSPRFATYTSSQKPVALYIKGEVAPVVAVGAAGWTSFVPAKNVAFPQGVNAYIVTANNTESVTLTVVDAVKAGTPVLVEALEGEYALEVVEESACDDVTTNLLSASDGNVTGNGSIYALGQKNGVVGLYLVADGVTIPAGKAYLNGGGNGVKTFVFGSETAIQNVEAAANNAAIYNLAGQRVQKAVKGLYIQNGRKFIVK